MSSESVDGPSSSGASSEETSPEPMTKESFRKASEVLSVIMLQRHARGRMTRTFFSALRGGGSRSSSQESGKSPSSPFNPGKWLTTERSSVTTDGDNNSPNNRLTTRRQSLSRCSTVMTSRQRHMTAPERQRVAKSAREAREALLPFAEEPAPSFSLGRGILYGATIDWALVSPLRCQSRWFANIVDIGGPEQVRFLLAVARFDVNGDGVIDDDEWKRYEELAEEITDDAYNFSGNLSLIAALMLSLTHLLTMGRPVPFTLSSATEDHFGEHRAQWLLWMGYGSNVISECCGFFTLVISIVTRSCMTNVIPTKETKIAMWARAPHSEHFPEPPRCLQRSDGHGRTAANTQAVPSFAQPCFYCHPLSAKVARDQRPRHPGGGNAAHALVFQLLQHHWRLRRIAHPWGHGSWRACPLTPLTLLRAAIAWMRQAQTHAHPLTLG